MMTSNESGSSGGPVFDRVVCEYKNLSDKFIISTSDYSRQFSHIYTMRLKKMRENLVKAARAKWDADIPIVELYQLQDQDESLEKCIIIGTLYKQQILKPNILKEVSEEHQLELQPPRTQFCDDSDELVLEDELQRIILLGKIDVHSVVTGVVCAVLGRDDHEGKFYVEDHCFVNLEPHVYKPLPEPERLVVLVSGLAIGGSHAADAALGAELLVEWLCGEAGSEQDQQRLASVVRVILAGNSLQECSQIRLMSRKLQNVEAGTQTVLLKGMVTLDEFLVQLLESVDVDLMPGEFDPCNNMMPQQPLHRCLLPESSRYPTMHAVSNPYRCEVGGRLLLGTSGQPIADMGSLCRQEDRLLLLQNSLEWGHIAPSSPDTLPCFPCYNDDPFIMGTCPDILFAGNQPKFQTKITTTAEGQQVRLVCVPSFSQTQTCVVVNLHTLDCYPISFSIPQLPSEQ